jgi:PAS domain-containing protein
MILLRSPVFWIISILSVICIVLLGIFGWYLLQGGGESQGLTISGPAAGQIKIIAERIFFTAIVFGGVIFVLCFLVFMASRKRTKQAENLLLSRRWQQSGPEEWRQRFGDLGTGFYRVNQDLLETNQRRGTKIRGMNSLASFLIKNFEAPVFVVNAAAEIVYVSNEYLELTEKSRSELLHKHVGDILSGVYFPELLSDFGKKPTMITLESGDRKYKVYNIDDNRGETVYMLFSLGNRSYQPAAGVFTGDDKLPKRRKRFSWFFK